ncbi:hypothetical protein LLG90_13475 [Aromatoleum toluclasticum]|nr:hypothetical protein [Aromatoleum toluclasticum]MCC4116365.1 hypothetical protein [Aromatoleum toluclasticum]
MNNVGAVILALAIAVGFSDVASAIRHANVSINFTAPMRITTEANNGAR